MDQDAFQLLERALQSGGPEAAFDFLIQKFREEKNYWLLFEALLMKKRQELGLPLIWSHSLDELPEETRRDYEQAYVDAAREVGRLFLSEDRIPHAWPYFRAIGETAPLAAALEKFDSAERQQEEIDSVIQIAFQEGVHPRKGIELILKHYGLCRAITNFSQYPGREGRQESIRLLVRTLCGELVESLKLTIARREGRQPDTSSVPELMAGRDWLFEQNSYYVDSSHLGSVVRFGLELNDRDTLKLLADLTDYGKRLAPMFQPNEHPPFDGGYQDYDVYVRALLGESVEEAVAYFGKKLSQADPARFGTYPAQIVVEFLARLERFEEAVELFLKYLQDVGAEELHCPSVAQLCQLAGDHKKLVEIAREKSDLLTFTAGLLQL